MEQWYLACYKPGKGNIYKAQAALCYVSCTAFCPQIRTQRPRADRPGQSRQSIEPLFPGYFFLLFDPEEIHTSRIEECPGVSYLVRSSGKITPIRSMVVEQLMCLPVCQDAFARKYPVRRNVIRQNQRIASQIENFIGNTQPDERGPLSLALIKALEDECDP
ncbi:transcription termination/antitermination NusG family protein [Citrobacter koseri]|uniref:transcription termination/antitermination NusG family protein n=1 Tax=Citrobacter koseri TaxID=545 RepID=UPI001F2F6EFD|nr:transcription termination/antitermination NusG family protein [Citrobacter koseri]